ncbi:MAG: phosphate ABC transporter substrate-binding protein PstS [Burkholderiaceae bacterium]|nr:phosphate ABC transporter substrate-binding protein PstS [Burkholderiaceae bacterium]
MQVPMLTRVLAGVAVAALPLAAQAIDLTGAGASFPAPVYAKWAEAYKAQTGHAINYQAIGSGGGIKQIVAKTVDFGATDDPVPGDQLRKDGLVQFPAVIGGVVPVVNVEGVAPGKMVLDARVLAAIFSGKVSKWNDPALAKLNPTLELPNQAITPVYRSDSSGTTAVFTGYLADIVPAFKQDVGAGKTVDWPAGIGGKGNAGVAANVMKLKGSIGYVEYAYAKQNKLAHTGLVNRHGNTVQPDEQTFAAAGANADWTQAPGFGISLNNQASASAWPITSATFILMHRKPVNVERSTEVLKFFRWALEKGGELAKDLDYVPMPANTVKLIEESWREIEGIGNLAVASK